MKKRSFRSWTTLPLLVFAGVLPGTAEAAALEVSPESEKHFALKVLPLFKEKCLACHGDDPEKIKGGLDMRSLKTLLQGGESGIAALIPGKPETSPIYTAVTRTDDDTAMPPKENDKLSATQMEILHRWIQEGAPWPEEGRIAELVKADAAQWQNADGVMVKHSGGLSPEWTNRRYQPEDLWAYAPLRAQETTQKGPAALDTLIAQKMAELGVTPAPLADRRTLIRRATFDLLGLPPTLEEIATFLADPGTDEAAFATLIARLLASPHYGEQWGRHWLDVVRYADSSGFANDYERGNTWRYRDYVIRAFNSDKPYDQFIREQIAGDELGGPGAVPDPEKLIATGFLRMGPWELTGMEVPKVARQRFLDDVTDITGQAFLGHTLQCARCHDHKFDPVPTRDYYSIQACFATTQLSERAAPFLPEENTLGFEEKRFLEMRRATHLATLKRLDEQALAAVPGWYAKQGLSSQAWDEALAEARAQGARPQPRRDFVGYFDATRARLQQKQVPEDQYPPKQLGFSVDDYGHDRIARKGLERLRWEFERYEPYAFSVYAGRTPDLKSVYAPQRVPRDPMNTGELEETTILGGGDPFSPTVKVSPGTLSALWGASAPVPQSITGRRKALAEWIASPNNPLTSRSLVNRVWQWHFGQAIAGNPNNFGTTGKKPTNPALLDWLAQELVSHGWSIKHLHRVIMMSQAYRRSSEHPDRAQLASKDPLGISHAVFKPRRLTAEELRDAMLAASGELNPTLGGIPVRPEINVEAAMQPRQVMGTFATAWQPNPLPATRHRRSVYVLKLHGLRDPFMEVFNEPTPEFSCEGRDASNVTPQVFSLFNSEPSYDRALALAHRVLHSSAQPKTPVPPSEAIHRAFLLTCGQAPTAAQSTACLQHWERMTQRHAGLRFDPPHYPKAVVREAVEENTGEKFTFHERLEAYEEFVSDLKPADLDARTRGFAEVCLVLFNSNSFGFVY